MTIRLFNGKQIMCYKENACSVNEKFDYKIGYYVL
jgi:hypothetical protein